MTPERKTFKTPEMAEQYLGHSTEPYDVDWTTLPEDTKALRPDSLAKGIEQRRAQRRPRRRTVGNRIREMLAVR